jgi:dephospho-CoA kinase
LNEIVHPLMFQDIDRRIKAKRTTGFTKPIVIEAAILIEANWLPLADEVWLIVTNKTAVIDRVATQRGMAAKDTEARIASQLSDGERRKHAQVVIENNGSLEELQQKIRVAWSRVSL